MADLSSSEPDQSVEQPKGRRRGITLLPNVITTGALFSGFFAMVAAMDQKFETSAIAIFAAMILDAADGRIARLTRTESEFGAQYDSLSDMVAFGIAPGILAFSWALRGLGKVGWAAAFIYVVCAALRLARYNTAPDNKSFTGLASPSAAAIVASMVWLWTDFGLGEPPAAVAWGMAAVTALVGLLMVSRLRYFSPKTIDLHGRVPFVTLVLCALGFALVLANPPTVLLLLFVGYALSGPATYAWQKLQQGRLSRRQVANH